MKQTDPYVEREVRRSMVGVPVCAYSGAAPSVPAGGMVVVHAMPFQTVLVSRLRFRSEAGLYIDSARIGTRCLEAATSAGIAFVPEGSVWRFVPLCMSPTGGASLTISNRTSRAIVIGEAVWWGVEVKERFR